MWPKFMARPPVAPRHSEVSSRPAQVCCVVPHGACTAWLSCFHLQYSGCSAPCAQHISKAAHVVALPRASVRVPVPLRPPCFLGELCEMFSNIFLKDVFI